MSWRSTLSRYWPYALLTAVSLITALLFWNQAFPAASLQFTITRENAEKENLRIATAVGATLEGYTAATVFDEEEDTNHYLERERGLAELERYVREGVTIWSWQTRWFKPEQEEEYSAAIDPQGRLVAYDHDLEEHRAIPTVTKDEARHLAEDFIRQHVRHHPLDQLKFIEDGATERPARTDYSFTWERPSLRVGEASYRLLVQVYGNAVGGYTEWLKIPEAWERDFEKKRELNKLCQKLAEYASLPVYLGAFVLFIFSAPSTIFRKSIPAMPPRTNGAVTCLVKCPPPCSPSSA